jgi:probable phosphoglycerate mutase
MGTWILLARHGETDWNRTGRFQGHADPGLNPSGRQQSAALAEQLAALPAFDVLYSSDLGRARETAEIVGSRLGLEVVTRDALREIDVGSWSGLTREEIQARFPEGWAAWRDGRIDGHDGESPEQFSARVVAATLELGARHAGARLLVITHGGVVRSLQRVVFGEPLPVLENCGTWEVKVVEGRLVSPGQ